MQAAKEMESLEDRAMEVSSMLRLVANPKRLLVLCRLALEGEMSVGALGAVVKLSQSALSQHLAKLRAQGLVCARRESQTLHYRIADDRVARLLESLYDIYCAQQESNR
jgi:ArsR family transcriptional regulator, virulence genes transcriptional regulator